MDPISIGHRPSRHEAFLSLVKEAEPLLRDHLRRHHGLNGALLDDIIQKSYLKAWGSEAFDPARPDARGFLFTIAENTVIDWRRSMESRLLSYQDLSARGSLGATTIDPNSRDPLARAIAKESSERLWQALEQVGRNDRDLLVRYYILREGTQLEISQKLGMTVAVFNNRLNQARLALRRVLAALSVPESWRDDATEID